MSNLYAEIFSSENTPKITQPCLNQHLFQIKKRIFSKIF